MHSDRQYFLDLLKKHLNGQLSDEDVIVFSRLLDKIPEEEQKLLFKQVWQEVSTHPNEEMRVFTEAEKQNIFKEILVQDSQDRAASVVPVKKHRRLYAPYMVASMLLLTLGIGLFFYFNSNDIPTETVAVQQPDQHGDVDPESDRAILTTEDGEKITLEGKQVGVIKSAAAFNIVRLQSGEIQYQSTGKAQSPQRHTVSTPRGGQINFLLPDGSKVWLNTASSLTFSSDMTQDDRIVDMTGEVYFEVVKRQGQRFLVKGHFGQIDVLGTKFNVNAYDRMQSATALLEGAVQLESSTAKVQLAPGQLATVRSDGRINKAEVPHISNLVLWKDGFFFFDRADVHSVAVQLARWYDIEVAVQGSNPQQVVTGTISRHVKLSQMIEMLDYLGMKCSYKNNKLIIL